MAVPGTVASDCAGVTVIWSACAAEGAEGAEALRPAADALGPAAAMLAVPVVTTASAALGGGGPRAPRYAVPAVPRGGAPQGGRMRNMASIPPRARRENRGGRNW